MAVTDRPYGGPCKAPGACQCPDCAQCNLCTEGHSEGQHARSSQKEIPFCAALCEGAGANRRGATSRTDVPIMMAALAVPPPWTLEPKFPGKLRNFGTPLLPGSAAEARRAGAVATKRPAIANPTGGNRGDVDWTRLAACQDMAPHGGAPCHSRRGLLQLPLQPTIDSIRHLRLGLVARSGYPCTRGYSCAFPLAS